MTSSAHSGAPSRSTRPRLSPDPPMPSINTRRPTPDTPSLQPVTPSVARSSYHHEQSVLSNRSGTRSAPPASNSLGRANAQSHRQSPVPTTVPVPRYVTSASVASRSSHQSAIILIAPPPLTDLESLQTWFLVEFPDTFTDKFWHFLFTTLQLNDLKSFNAFCTNNNPRSIITRYGTIVYDQIRDNLIQLKHIWYFAHTFDPAHPRMFNHAAFLRNRELYYDIVLKQLPPSDVLLTWKTHSTPAYTPISQVVMDSFHSTDYHQGTPHVSWNTQPRSVTKDPPEVSSTTSSKYKATTPRCVDDTTEMVPTWNDVHDTLGARRYRQYHMKYSQPTGQRRPQRTGESPTRPSPPDPEDAGIGEGMNIDPENNDGNSTIATRNSLKSQGDKDAATQGSHRSKRSYSTQWR